MVDGCSCTWFEVAEKAGREAAQMCGSYESCPLSVHGRAQHAAIKLEPTEEELHVLSGIRH